MNCTFSTGLCLNAKGVESQWRRTAATARDSNVLALRAWARALSTIETGVVPVERAMLARNELPACLLYTSDAADE